MSSENIASLVAQIESENREEFLSLLKQMIEHDIASRSATQCLTVITTSPSGRSASWSFSDGAPYFERLWAFMWNKPFTESGTTYVLDSALTVPILEIVTTGVLELISSYQDEIADVVVTEALINASVRDTLVDAMLQSGMARVATTKVKSALTAHLLSSVHDRLHDLGVHAMTGAVAAVTKIASLSAGPIILQKLATAIVAKLGPIVAKLLAKPAVAAMLKKFIGAAILSSVLKAVAAKAGGAALTTILFPIIIGWLVMDYAAFPRKLGAGVAEALCNNLRTSFRTTMSEIVSKIVTEFSEGATVKDLAAKLAKDPEITKALNEAMVKFG